MNKGFFSQKETQSTKIKGKSLSCASCGLFRNALTPKMKPYGNFSKQILNIGEAPGEREDEKGRQWQGKVGRLLKKTYRRLEVDLFEDCLNVNSVNCRPPKNRTPKNHEIDCCREVIVDNTISENQPKLIIALGNAALYSLIGHRWKKDFGGITKWRGWIIPDKEHDAWIAPVYHPSYIERMDDKACNTIWEQDLKRAFETVNSYFPKFDKKKIHYIEDLSILNDIQTDLVAIDYETTGLKPYGKGHKIVCASVAVSDSEVYAFMMPESKKQRQPFIDLLKNPKISKMAHNMKFEEIWSDVILGQPVINWAFDSMLAAHILDNRPGITGLKFQTYVQFGVIDYDSDINKYLKGTREGANAFNRVEELAETERGRKKLLTYCALDSLYEYRLAMRQMQQMNFDFLPF
jgi:uracil-DNA glycosylase family 4